MRGQTTSAQGGPPSPRKSRIGAIVQRPPVVAIALIGGIWLYEQWIRD